MASALTPLLLIACAWILAASVLPGEAYGDPKPIDWNIYDKRYAMHVLYVCICVCMCTRDGSEEE